MKLQLAHLRHQQVTIRVLHSIRRLPFTFSTAVS